jgi:DNA primase
MTDQIKSAVAPYLNRMRAAGPEEVSAVCPFHRRADGSEGGATNFFMNVYSGLWFCHSCHARGNLYTFLRDVGLSRDQIKMQYQPALDDAGKYAPPPPDPVNPVEAVLEPLDEGFLGYFDYCPQQLLDDGFPMELLRRFDIGYDWTHHRITFPLRDWRGRLVGISGRAAQDGVQPRYKLYDKEYLAFGLPIRKTERRPLIWNIHNVLLKQHFTSNPEVQPLVIVEGYKAALRVAQANVEVGALLGSHITQEQIWLLQKLDCPLLFMFDNDDAGRMGQLDACHRLSQTGSIGHRLFVVDYAARQPSDLTPHAVLEALLAPQPFMEWFVRNS